MTVAYPIDAVLDTACAAVRTASLLCMRVAAEGPERLEKTGREPVTVADYGSQAVILGMVAAEFPGHGVLAEEGSAHLFGLGGDGATEALAALVAEVTGDDCKAEDLARRIDHVGGSGELTWRSIRSTGPRDSFGGTSSPSRSG